MKFLCGHLKKNQDFKRNYFCFCVLIHYKCFLLLGNIVKKNCSIKNSQDWINILTLEFCHDFACTVHSRSMMWIGCTPELLFLTVHSQRTPHYAAFDCNFQSTGIKRSDIRLQSFPVNKEKEKRVRTMFVDNNNFRKT